MRKNSPHRFGFLVAAMAVIVCGGFAHRASALVINEIMYDVPGNDANREWVELYNNETNPVTLTTGTGGWRFFDGANHVFSTPIQSSLVIPVGGFAVLSASSSVFLAEHMEFTGTVIRTALSLGNTGETLRIIDTASTVRDVVTYAKSWGASGNGRTLERRMDGAWGESYAQGGTPGAENSIDAPPPPSPSANLTPSPSVIHIATPAAPLVTPRYTRTPSAKLHVDIAQNNHEDADATASLPLHTTTPSLSADVVASHAAAYRSFFVRHALLLVILFAGVCAAGLIRWKKSISNH